MWTGAVARPTSRDRCFRNGFAPALSRMAGLRCPPEIIALIWDAINWERGGLTVLAKKEDGAPRRRPRRADRADLPRAAGDPGRRLRAGGPGVNVRGADGRQGGRDPAHPPRADHHQGLTQSRPDTRLCRGFCRAAGRAASRIGVEKYPAHVVAPWLGHSPKVTVRHYLMSREHHFEHVVRGDAANVSVIAEKPVAPTQSCDS